MSNIETYAAALWAEHEQPGHTPKNKDEILMALVNSSSIVSITVQTSAFETATITIEDLLKQHWSCVDLKYLIQDWAIKQAKGEKI